MIETFRIIDGPAESAPVNRIVDEAPRERRQQVSPLAAASVEFDVMLKSMIRCVALIVVGWGFVLMSVSVLSTLTLSEDTSSNASVSEVEIRDSQVEYDM